MRDDRTAVRTGARAAAALLAVLAAGAGLAFGGARAASPEPDVVAAARAGDLEALKARLRAGADANAAQGDGFTGLHWAARNDDVEVARVLLAAGADAGATTRLGGHAPLHVAARSGSGAVVKLLLAAGVPPDAPTSTGATPLHYAAWTGVAEPVEILVGHGADVNAREPAWGQTPLMFAAGRGRTDAVTALLAAGADPAITATVLDIAARAESDRDARRLRQERLDRERGAAGVIYDRRQLEKRRKEAQRRAQEAEKKADAEKGRTAADEASEESPEAPETADIKPPGASGSAASAEAEEEAEAAAKLQAEKDAHAEAHGHPEDDLEDDEDLEEEDAEEGEGEEDDEESDEPQPLRYPELVGTHGGLTALLLAARDGHFETALALVDAGADVNQQAEGHLTSPLLMAAINGHFDLGMELLARGADPNVKNVSGAAPLYAAINARWISQPFHPQPADHLQQTTSHVEFMEALLDAGAEINARLERKQWYSTYNTDQLGVDRAGATAFWRAAYALDIPAMKMLVARGADPHLPTVKVPERRLRRLTSLVEEDEDEEEDPSGLPPVPYGGPAVHPIHAAAGVGYGLGLAANSHRHAPDSWMPAMRYLVEELGADVSARDHNGYSVIHHAASRGDNEMIEFLISKGADPLVVARTGQTTVDLANGPVQRISPFPETIALLESHGAKNNNRCVGC